MLYAWILVSALLYVLCAVSASLYLRTLERRFLRNANLTGVLAFVLHLGFLSLAVLDNDGSFQAASMISNFVVTALAAFVGLILIFRKKFIMVAIVLFPLVAISLAVLTWVSQKYSNTSLPSAWLWAHIGLMVAGEALFFIAATIAGAYILLYRTLRRKHGLHVLTSISSLPALDRGLGILLNLGFVLLSIGLILGVLFAKQFWEGDWWKDSKVVFAALIWIAYGILVSLRLFVFSFRGYRSALGAVIGFVSILVFSVGLNTIFPSQHLGRGVNPISTGSEP